MADTLQLQLYQAGLCLAVGLFCGVLYDFFRAVRRRVAGRAVGAVCDALFCAAACSALFLLGLTAGQGRQRVVFCVVAIIGGGLYGLFLSYYVLGAWSAVLGAVAAVLRFVKRALVCVFLTAYNILRKPIGWFLRICYKFVNKLCGQLKKGSNSAIVTKHKFEARLRQARLQRRVRKRAAARMAEAGAGRVHSQSYAITPKKELTKSEKHVRVNPGRPAKRRDAPKKSGADNSSGDSGNSKRVVY
ncbi:MAG: hypothetical protein LBQ91_03225 [Oscillospiraceae bacterium]|jgi:hypothetical protein|nr:hypothetical protein [Oscillospiraceae bacterium]